MKRDIIWGLVTGILLCGWIMLEYFLGLHHEYLYIGDYSGYAAAIIPVITMYIAISAKKKENIDNRIDIWQGLVTGFIMSVIIGVMVTGFMLLYKTEIDPGYDQRYAEWKISSMIEANKPDYQIAQKKEYLEKSGTPMYYIMGIVVTVILGLSVALVESILIILNDNRKEDKRSEPVSY